MCAGWSPNSSTTRPGCGERHFLSSNRTCSFPMPKKRGDFRSASVFSLRTSSGAESMKGPPTTPNFSSVEEIGTALGENLLSGRFVLVVAAPVIPEPVRRVLDYMNAQGLRLYGLEVS